MSTLDAKRPVALLLVLLTAFAAGLALTAYGFLYLSNSPGAGAGWRWSVAYLGMFLGLATTIALAGAKWGARTGGMLVGGLLALMGGAAVAVIVLSLLALSAYVLGRIILRSSEAARTDCLLAGTAIYGTVLSLLVHFPVNTSGTWALLFAVPLALCWRHVCELWPLEMSRNSAGWWLYGLECSVIAVLLLHLLVSLMPEVGHDALAMHLFAPSYVAYYKYWPFDVDTYVWAVMPMLVDWLYSAAYMFAGETGARMTNFGGILLLSILVRRLALWTGAREAHAAWAMLLLLVSPLAFTESSSLFIEGMWSAFAVCGTLAVLRLLTDTRDARVEILLAALVLGCALASKIGSMSVIPVLAVLVAVGSRRWYSPALLKTCFLGLVVFLCTGLVPYIYAYWRTGNPLFPFLNGIFRSPLSAPVSLNTHNMFDSGMHWDTLYRMAFHSYQFMECTAGASGFQWMLLVVPLGLALLVLRHKRGLTVALIGTLWLVLTFSQTAYLRYVFPSFALASVVVAAAMSSLERSGGWLSGLAQLVAALTVLLNLLHFNSATWYGRIDYRVLLDPKARDAYIETMVPLRTAAKMVNSLNLGHTPVACFSSPLMADLKADALYTNWYNQNFLQKTMDVQDGPALARLLSQRGVEYVIVEDTSINARLAQLVAEATAEVQRIGNVSVRQLHESVLFTEELVPDPTFAKPDSWSLGPGALHKPGEGVQVTVNSSSSVVVKAESGTKYLYTAEARCIDGPAKGRLQVNWLDRNGAMTSTNIEVFDCSRETSVHSMTVRAPVDASNAVVYASAHGDTPVLFSKVSFKD